MPDPDPTPTPVEVRDNDQNLTRHELLVLFEGKSIPEIAELMSGIYTGMLERNWTTWSASNMLAFAISATNRPQFPEKD